MSVLCVYMCMLSWCVCMCFHEFFLVVFSIDRHALRTQKQQPGSTADVCKIERSRERAVEGEYQLQHLTRRNKLVR